MTQDNLRDYTYTGSFSLKSGNTILGEIHYVKNVTKHYKLYRVADFINALKLSRNYTTHKNKKTHTQRIELQKYCKKCGKHTLHKETK